MHLQVDSLDSIQQRSILTQVVSRHIHLDKQRIHLSLTHRHSMLQELCPLQVLRLPLLERCVPYYLRMIYEEHADLIADDTGVFERRKFEKYPTGKSGS